MSEGSSSPKRLVRPLKWGLPTILFGLLALYGAQLAVEAVAVLVWGQDLAKNTSLQILLRGVTYLVALGGIWQVLKYSHTSSRDLGFGRITARYIKWALVGLPVYIVLSELLRVLCAALFPAINFQAPQELGLGEGNSTPELIMIFVVLVVLAPLVEEILFRGLIFRSALKYFRPLGAALFTSVLFGLAHLQWNVSLDTFALSLVLCFMVYKTQSIWPAVLLHATKNSIAFLLVFIIKN